MHMRDLPPLTLPAAIALALTACSAPAPAPAQRACTMIGCEDGLTVVVEGTPRGAYRVEARAEGEPPRVRECTSPEACGQVFFAGFLPGEVTVEVTAVGGARSSRTVRPRVETVQPNGPDCPPTCRQGRVTVPWPSGAS
jgi:hypothetical protein